MAQPVKPMSNPSSPSNPCQTRQTHVKPPSNQSNLDDDDPADDSTTAQSVGGKAPEQLMVVEVVVQSPHLALLGLPLASGPMGAREAAGSTDQASSLDAHRLKGCLWKLVPSCSM
jgi:hypothetical protein